MKSKFFISLMLASAIGSGFASSTSVSTLAERDAMVKDAFSKGSSDDALKDINEAQQEGGKVKVDEQHYVVVIKKDGDKYVRVAHYKKDKLNQQVEQSIINVMHEAEAKLAGTSGPVIFSFSTGDTKHFAVLSKHGDYLIFNICSTQEEVEESLKGTKPAEAKPEAVKEADTKTELVKAESKPAESAEAPKPEEKKADKPAAATAA